MAWKKPPLEWLREVLLLAVWTCLVIDGIIAAIFTVDFTYNLFTFLKDWLDRKVFDEPW